MKNIVFFLIVLFFATSCETAFMTPEPTNNPQSVFEQVWQFADKKYSFFDYKNVDWNATKTKYQALIKDQMTEEELFKVCADMLGELKDGHVNLKSDFDIGRNWGWYLNYAENFSYSFIERNYFKTKEQLVQSFILYDFGDILYVYYSDFSNDVSEESMDYVINRLKGKKGLIIDIRGNPGGNSGNIYTIASRFINKSIQVGDSWVKNGAGHEDFRKEKEVLSYNADELHNDTTPIVVLTNRNCYSSANFFTMYMKALPQVTVVGDKTGGGGGTPAMSDLSNGWKIRVSTTRTLDNSGFNIENGVEPHVKTDWSKTDENLGKDTILEKGLAILRK